MKLDYMVLVNQFLKSSEGIWSTFIFKVQHSCELTHGSIFRQRLPLKNKDEMSMNLGMESIFIQPRHQKMYWSACADRQTILGCEIGGIPRSVTMKCDLPQNRRRGNQDFGTAFLEKMNDNLFWCGTKIACGRWWESCHLVSVAFAESLLAFIALLTTNLLNHFFSNMSRVGG
jgi:hypothetical protein